jgi:hypothetical protein
MPKQTRLAGMPAPSDELVAKQQALIHAFETFHKLFLETFEAIPEGGTVTIARKIKGDVVKVSFRSGQDVGSE